MSNSSGFSDDMIRSYIKGELSDEDSFRFMRQMELDPLLSEEVRLVEAMMRVERDRFIEQMQAKAEGADDHLDVQPREAKSIPLPVYRQSWFRVAAALVVATGIGWTLFENFGIEKTTLATTIPLRQSVDGSLGWSSGAAGTEKVEAVLILDKSGVLRYRYSGDTLKIFTPESLKPLDKRGKLYLIDDLKNRRLVLVIDGRKYPINSAAENETPLIEE